MEIPLGRRFRALKIWFVIRSYGISGIKQHIKRHIELAEKFHNLVKSDERFQVVFPLSMGLVCFKLKVRL